MNVTLLSEARRKIVCYLDPAEYKSMWVANKAIYRTRLAVADGGELVVLAPGVKVFASKPPIDALIRKYGYVTTPELLAAAFPAWSGTAFAPCPCSAMAPRNSRRLCSDKHLRRYRRSHPELR